MKASGKYLAIILTALCVRAAFALPSVTIDSVVQRWPWNNKVDITYTVGGVETLVNGGYYRVVFTTTIPGRAEPIVIDGSSDVIAKAVAGTHTVTWTPPDGVFGMGCTMNVDLYESTGDYMIVDLDTGNYAFEDLRATQAESNARYNTAQNKGERLVLRKVAKTSENAYSDGYPTGNSTTYPTGNTETNWTTTADYFIGIFELTSAQYDRLMSGTASESYKPKASVKWQTLRGVGASASSTGEVTANAAGAACSSVSAPRQGSTSTCRPSLCGRSPAAPVRRRRIHGARTMRRILATTHGILSTVAIRRSPSVVRHPTTGDSSTCWEM